MENLLPKRNLNTNKGDYGKVAIIAGSRGMTGAAYLASQSALRTGSGLVYTFVPSSLETIMCTKLTEAIIKSVPDEGKGCLLRESVDYILSNLKGMDSIAIGPGLGLDEGIIDIIDGLIQSVDIPMVIDADGLNALSKDMDILYKKKNQIIVTPHPGEMSRLLNVDISEIESKRVYYAKYLSEKYNIITLLKGHETIVASADGEVYINKTGNPGMATAGSGDVLTGIIASLVGQNIKAYDATKLGAYLHGLSGDLARDKLGEYSMIASDIMESIPYGIISISS